MKIFMNHMGHYCPIPQKLRLSKKKDEWESVERNVYSKIAKLRTALDLIGLSTAHAVYENEQCLENCGSAGDP